jgi:hypothetical protein
MSSLEDTLKAFIQESS